MIKIIRDVYNFIKNKYLKGGDASLFNRELGVFNKKLNLGSKAKHTTGQGN